MKILRKKCVIVIFMVLLFSSCGKPLLKGNREAEHSGNSLYLYIMPLPKDSGGLVFRLRGVSAVRENGDLYPLTLSVREFSPSKIRRQRLIGGCGLPAGTYIGLSFTLDGAFVTTTEGKKTLGIPEKPVVVDFPFKITNKGGLLLVMKFTYKGTKGKDSPFVPSFSLFLPERPVESLMGFISLPLGRNFLLFDKGTNQVARIVPTGRGPGGFAIDAERSRIYVPLSGDDSVEAIDLKTTRRIVKSISRMGDRPVEVRLIPGRRELLVVNEGSNTVTILDPLSLVELRRIPVELGPRSAAIDREGKRAYVFNSTSNSISVIDIATARVSATISTESGPLRGEFNRRENRLYVIHRGSPYLVSYDPVTRARKERVFVGRGLSSIKVDSRTDLIYLGREKFPGVEVFDPFSLLPVEFVKTEGGISYITIDDEKNNLYLVVPEKKSVSVVNLVSHRRETKIDTGSSPGWVSMSGER